MSIKYQLIDANNTPIVTKGEVKPSIFGMYRIKGVSKYKRNYKMQGITFKSKKITIKLTSQEDPLQQVRKSKFVAAGFQAFGDNDSERDYLRILTSNDGVHYKRLATSYPNIKVRDPNIVKMGDKWVIAYTDGILWTTDFKKWHQGVWNIDFQKYSAAWAPCFFLDKDGWKIAVSMFDKSTPQNGFLIHVFRFNIQNFTVEDEVTCLKLPMTNVIDPQMVYSNGVYRLWYKDETNKKIVFASSKNLYSDFSGTSTSINDFQNNRKLVTSKSEKGWYFEAPEFLKTSSTESRLYFDTYDFSSAANSHYHGMYYSNINEKDKNWSFPKPVISDFKIRHFSVIRQY